MTQDQNNLPNELANLFPNTQDDDEENNAQDQQIQIEEYEAYENRNEENEDEDDDIDNLNIDEVEKVDNNLRVDEDFQNSLNERINELSMKDNTHSLLSISRPSVKYQYDDKINLKDDLNEWFSSDEAMKLAEFKQVFFNHFPLECSFNDLDHEEKVEIISQIGQSLMYQSVAMRLDMLKCLLYVSLGAFEGQLVESPENIKKNVNIIITTGLINPFLVVMKDKFNQLKTHNDQIVANSYNLFLSASVIYVCIVSKLDSYNQDPNDEDIGFKATLDACNFLDFLTKSIGSWRWNAKASLRIRNIIILFTKTFQYIIGDLSHKKQTKAYLRTKFGIRKETDENKLTNSPIEYHVFRQELIARYPSYIPPLSKLPMESLENPKSVLQYITNPKSLSMNTTLHKHHNPPAPPPALHIATPVPSPPLSPQNTGGPNNRPLKNKRSFQTNTNYPFIFPVENNCSDEVPVSIKEATELFNSRVVEKLSLKQLWNEGDLFVRQERRLADGMADVPQTFQGAHRGGQYLDDMFEYFHEVDEENQKFINSLNRVEEYYKDTLPNLVSVAHVFIEILNNSKDDCVQIENGLTEGTLVGKQLEIFTAKQILVKNIAYVIRLMLEWFKVSHVLKFEYFSSLLHDSNFIEVALHPFRESSINERINYIRNNPPLVRYKQSIWATRANPVLSRPSSSSSTASASTCTLPDTTYLFTEINLLTILTHITLKKSHRLTVLLTNDKDPSDVFHNILAVYNPHLWPPVLHMIKTLASISGKKWKSNNMDLISLVYLHLKMELSDNWLMGRDLEKEANEGISQEVALRALVKFYNERKYPFNNENLELGDQEDLEGLASQETPLDPSLRRKAL
ncbi:hypothetical protein WICPIJ_002704 [Wickerhamomyces pijperi]|uniref:Factor arrest protein 11 n=1 Tax=Wickerhamomyces pijperi TaxID=599730 RepID=A0A9P8Q8J1_WICPI|nr:hypothetical protein WICPIJ_002704 [Wickerhamomyces pijperi]